MKRNHLTKNQLLFIFAVFLLVATFLGDILFKVNDVEGSSMEPILMDQDTVVINKLAYQLAGPKRFDVIVFPYEKEENIYYIKRVVGLPGETLQIINGVIYIDDKPVKEEYGKESMDEYSEGLAKEKVILGEDEYFVLGDNRNNSKDSRDPSVGMVRRLEILGRAVFRVYPFCFL